MHTMQLSKQLRLLRTQRGWSQEAVAEKLGVTGQAVSKWEQGVSCPDIGLLPELAALYAVSVDMLLGVEAAPGLGDAMLTLRRVMSEQPAEELYDAAYQLAFVLHEGLCTGGYRERVPWQVRDCTRPEEMSDWLNNWGLSARSEPQGMTVMRGNAVAFTSARRRARLNPGQIRGICQWIAPLSQPSVLKTLFALADLSDVAEGYASVEQIAQHSGLREGAVLQALDQLPVEEGLLPEGLPGYRLAEHARSWPELLGLFTAW